MGLVFSSPVIGATLYANLYKADTDVYTTLTYCSPPNLLLLAIFNIFKWENTLDNDDTIFDRVKP
jgi:hypothetical protein